jgi:hemoglobin
MTEPSQPTAPTAYQRLGGIDAIRPVVDEFYARVLADPGLAPYFVGLDVARIKRHQVLFLASLLGGSITYPGRSLGVAHSGIGITSEDYDRVAVHLRAVLEDAGAPGDIVAAVADAVAAVKDDIVDVATSG